MIWQHTGNRGGAREAFLQEICLGRLGRRAGVQPVENRVGHPGR